MSRMGNLMRRLIPGGAPMLERRIHRRAVLAWRNARGDRPLVTLERFDPLAIEDRSSHGFLLDLRGSEPLLVYVGPVLMQEAGLAEAGVPLAAAPETSLVAQFAAHHPRALESADPITAEYEFVTPARYRVLCRGALLPLSSDGERIDHVYGVVNWKSEKLPAAAN